MIWSVDAIGDDQRSCLPAYVLIHGAWDGGWSWKPIRDRLTEAGAAVFTPSLTGSGERVHLGGPHVALTTYITDVVNVIHYEQLRDLVLVGFSFGGMTATGVAGRIPAAIAHLVYLDAFVPKAGQAFTDLIPAKTAASFADQARTRGGGWAIPAPAEADARATPLPIGAITEALQLDAEPSLPRTYIRCIREQPGGHFDEAAARARREGGGYHELASGHHPMLEVPDDLAELLVKIAWAE